MLEIELELDYLFKQFASKCTIETMDSLASISKVPNKIAADIIDKKIAQIRRKMSDNNITIDKKAALTTIKEIIENGRESRSKSTTKKASLKDLVKSPLGKRISLEKSSPLRPYQHQPQPSMQPSIPSLTSTKTGGGGLRML